MQDESNESATKNPRVSDVLDGVKIYTTGIRRINKSMGIQEFIKLAYCPCPSILSLGQ